MTHTNLFLYGNEAAMQADYPNGKIDDVTPGVAYARTSGGEDPAVIYNNKKTTYAITLNLKNRSGATIGQSTTVQSPEAIEGEAIKMNIVSPDVDGYKPVVLVEKIEVSADGQRDVIYNAFTAYTVTVHHMYQGSPITADTVVHSDSVYETETVRVRIEPERVVGYMADAVTISVSGNMEYTLEYRVGAQYVDLGLPSGTLWADRNLGANSPEGFGNYYAWGEIAEKASYTVSNYKWGDINHNSNITKYNPSDGKEMLEAGDDVMSVSMGGDWHMPDVGAFYELMNYTDRAETTMNGVCGITFTSFEDSSKSIFIPYSSVKNNDPSWYIELRPGRQFGLWSRSLCTDFYNFEYFTAWGLDGESNGEGNYPTADVYGNYIFGYRHLGMPVRGVIGPYVSFNSGGGGAG